MDIIDNIFKTLKQKKLTQQALADYLGVSKQAISDWKNGNSYGWATKVLDICTFLDVSISYIYGEQDTGLPEEEKQLLFKYRQLDLSSKLFVQSVIDRELERSANTTTEKLIARGHKGDKPIEVKINNDVELIPSDEDL